MTIIDRLNKKADSLYLHDNGLRLIDINHNESIEFIFESYKWNNETEFSDDEKKELGLKPFDSIVLKETFYNIKILEVVFTTKESLEESQVLSNHCIDEHIIEFEFDKSMNEYFYIKFHFETFKWEILDVINEELVDVKKYVSIK